MTEQHDPRAGASGSDAAALAELASALAGDGVTVQRPDGTLAYANDRAARLLGFETADELLATPPAAIIARYEVLDEHGRPFPIDRFPGRRVLGGEEEVEEIFLWRLRDTGEEHWSIVKATAVRGADGQVLYAVNLFRDVTALRRREDWQRFLADSGEILNASLEYEATARELARLVVPSLADWCAVDVVGDDGRLEQIALEHADLDRVRWAREMRERYPSDENATTGVPEVIRSGRAELYEEITDELLVAGARDAAHLELLRRLELSSAMVVPLIARGRTLGALTFVTAESGRRYGDGDLVHAEDVARRAALAMDNARLHSVAQQARRDAELAASVSARLHAVTASLARTATVADVGRVVVSEGAAAIDADAAAVFLFDVAGDRFTLLAHAGYPSESEGDHTAFPATLDNPITEAFRTKAPVVIASGAELVERWPELATDQEATGDEVAVAQPIPSGEAVSGVLYVVLRSLRALADWELSFVETLASQCGHAIERANLYQRDHEAAVALQQTLLPAALPAIDGLSLDAHYVPARYESNVGGDWYDAMILDDGTIALSVGDVVGHGLAAAIAMGQLRNAIRAYLLEDISPGQVLRRLNRYAHSMGEGSFSTTVVATLDPTRTMWRFASAGHPPPVLVANGTARYLELRGPPVGAVDDFDYGTVEQVVTRPLSVVLYTDGLIERRGARLEEGLDRLLELVSTAPPDTSAESIVTAMLADDGPADDVAVLVVETVSLPVIKLDLPAEPGQLAVLRRELRPWLRANGLDERARHDVLVAVGEAAANAIEHPHDPRHPSFVVEARVEGDELIVLVSDSGEWRDPDLPTQRGRGLPFMRELMSEVEVRRGAIGTAVTLRRRLPSRVPT